MQYANSAEISRLNKGLKRRKERTVFGFNIDPRSGYWAKSEDEDPDVDVPPDMVKPVRIVPIVRDRKNALLIRFERPENYKPETVTTVQHALLRAIEVVFQLEEGEVLGEPLPARDNRRAILAYEATEGGAGVLNQLIENPGALAKVARQALLLMHHDNVDEAIAAGDHSLLVDREEEACVRGCYRCLLSYFNQPDHEMIDRASPETRQMLIDIARATVAVAPPRPRPIETASWLSAFLAAGMPAPDADPFNLEGAIVPYAWRAERVLATPAPMADTLRNAAQDRGWALFELPHSVDEGLPIDLIAAFKDR
jgi:hypothetical protein